MKQAFLTWKSSESQTNEEFSGFRHSKRVLSSNETIRDLLSPDTAPHSGLDLREDDNGVVVAGLSKHEFQGTDDVMNKLIQGNNNRSKGE